MKMRNWLVMSAAITALSLGTGVAPAQGQGQGGGRRNFDPAQMQQRMMENVKEQLEITSEDEWKVIQPLVQKVMESRMATMSGGRGMFGFGGRRGGGDNPPGGGPGGDRPRFGPPPSPEAEALQKAIDAKAPKAEIKAALEKYQAARKAKQADLEKAQNELRQVLTARQEAIATLNGWL